MGKDSVERVFSRLDTVQKQYSYILNYLLSLKESTQDLSDENLHRYLNKADSLRTEVLAELGKTKVQSEPLVYLRKIRNKLAGADSGSLIFKYEGEEGMNLLSILIKIHNTMNEFPGVGLLQLIASTGHVGTIRIAISHTMFQYNMVVCKYAEKFSDIKTYQNDLEIKMNQVSDFFNALPLPHSYFARVFPK